MSARDLVVSSYSDASSKLDSWLQHLPTVVTGSWRYPSHICVLSSADEAVRVAVALKQRMRTAFLSMRITGGCK